MAIDTEMPSFAWHLRTWEDIKASSLFTKINWTNFALVILFVGIAIRQAASKKAEAEKASREKRAMKAPDFPPVSDQPGFDYKKTEPLKLRPFKPKYHLTMALETLDPDDLLLMDKNYDDRIKYRRQIMTEHHDNVCAIREEKRIAPAIREFYTFIMGTYLPLRFPQMFKLHETEYETGKAFMLENRTNGEVLPASPSSKLTKSITLLETLGKTLDEDFLFLLPEDTEKDPKYVLYAYMTVCASGFNPSEKIGKRLAAIHEPVPGYAAKLEGSMDRFFDKLEVGKYVKRVNWAVTTKTDLYAAGSGTTHAHEGDKVEELEELDVDSTFVRCERQTLHRLPKSQALVFAFKTYLYPIKQIKDEGLGEQLIEAVNGLKTGNTPGMHFYKRGAVWGEAVKKYLRS